MLEIEEDFFVIYGFVTKSLHALMHPRIPADDLALPWPAEKRKRRNYCSSSFANAASRTRAK